MVGFVFETTRQSVRWGTSESVPSIQLVFLCLGAVFTGGDLAETPFASPKKCPVLADLDPLTETRMKLPWKKTLELTARSPSD